MVFVYAYTPQINLLLSSESTHGISPYYLLFNAIVGNTQLFRALLDSGYIYPNEGSPLLKTIQSGKLR